MNPGILIFTRFPSGSSVLTSLGPSLRSMLVHIDEYIKTYHRPEEGKPELPYFYNERANIGLLAGGIWRSEPCNLVFRRMVVPSSWKRYLPPRSPTPKVFSRLSLWYQPSPPRQSGRGAFESSGQSLDYHLYNQAYNNAQASRPRLPTSP